MEHISHPARRALEECARAMEAKKDGSERREGSEEIEPEAISREDSDQRSGIRREGATDGGMNCGQVSRILTGSPVEGRETLPIACPRPDADTIARTFRCHASNVRGIELRALAANDDRRDHAAGTFWRWS